MCKGDASAKEAPIKVRRVENRILKIEVVEVMYRERIFILVYFLRDFFFMCTVRESNAWMDARSIQLNELAAQLYFMILSKNVKSVTVTKDDGP